MHPKNLTILLLNRIFPYDLHVFVKILKPFLKFRMGSVIPANLLTVTTTVTKLHVYIQNIQRFYKFKKTNLNRKKKKRVISEVWGLTFKLKPCTDVPVGPVAFAIIIYAVAHLSVIVTSALLLYVCIALQIDTNSSVHKTSCISRPIFHLTLNRSPCLPFSVSYTIYLCVCLSSFRWLHEARQRTNRFLHAQEPLFPRKCLRNGQRRHVPGHSPWSPLSSGCRFLRW